MRIGGGGGDGAGGVRGRLYSQWADRKGCSDKHSRSHYPPKDISNVETYRDKSLSERYLLRSFLKTRDPL